MAKAAEIVLADRAHWTQRVTSLRERLWSQLAARVDGVTELGARAERLPNILAVVFAGLRGRELMLRLDRVGISVSTGSACDAASDVMDPVLAAMGLSVPQALGMVRFSLSRLSTDTEVDRVVAVLPALVKELRG
jgi:cysteine desulfurase